MRDDRNRYSDNNRGGGYGRRDERSNFNNGGDREQREMFPAVCDNCGKDCEVPFRPNGSKPVFCNDCFRKMGGNDREENSERFEFRKPGFEKPNFEKPNFEKREHARVESRPGNSLNDAYIKQQFDVLNTKLNKIMAALETKPEAKAKVMKALSEEAPVVEEVKDVSSKETIAKLEKPKKEKKASAKKAKKAE